MARADAAWSSPTVAQPTTEEYDSFRGLIARHAGIHLNDSKRALLYSRLVVRLQHLGLRTFGEYFDRVLRDPVELEAMTDRITTNETRFFREPAHFAFLQDHLLPGWERAAAAGQRSKEILVWSAGCSTGEEPYSLALSLLDRLGDAWTIQILGTDISTRALDAARSATWSIDRAREIPMHLLKRFMLQGVGGQAGKLRAGPEVRRLVRVEPLNLNAESYPVGRGFDLVLCRNVLIYFDAQQRRRVLDRLADHVAPGGHLFVGHAESVQGVPSLRALQPTIYAKRAGGKEGG